MLQLGGVSGERAVVVGLHVCVDAAVAEDIARGGQHCGVCAEPSAQRAVPAVRMHSSVSAAIGQGVLLQVEGGWGGGQGGEGFDGALIF